MCFGLNRGAGHTNSTLIKQIGSEFDGLSAGEKDDFLSRILILDESPRIENLPELIKDQHMRSIRREHRDFVFERLEGWWHDQIIKQLTQQRNTPIHGYEVSDKLSSISEEYKADNLPITFRGKSPADEIDIAGDSRLFVRQLREIGIASSRVIVGDFCAQLLLEQWWPR